MLHRHGHGKVSATRLTSAAVAVLIDGQALADRDAGLHWSAVTVPASYLDEALDRAHESLPVNLDDPTVWAYPIDQRCVLAGRLGLQEGRVDDLSRWVLAHPGEFDAVDLRCWRIGSATWLALAGEQLGPVGCVERPVGVFVVPAFGPGDGWQLVPVLALETIRLIAELGGRLERDLRCAVVPFVQRDALLERLNVHTLHAGPRQCLDSASQLAQELSRELRAAISPGVPREKGDRWGRLAVHRRSYVGANGVTTAELELRVLTFGARGFSQRRLGSAPHKERYAHPSAVMDLGEAVQTGVDAGLPLLLSSEAAGHLKDTVRVGADERSARGAHDHQLRRCLGQHPRRGRRAGARRAAQPEERRGEGDALGGRSAGGADDARAAAGRRSGAARPPARDGGAEGADLIV